jgi:hypothetical protein
MIRHVTQSHEQCQYLKHPIAFVASRSSGVASCSLPAPLVDAMSQIRSEQNGVKRSSPVTLYLGKTHIILLRQLI